MGLTGTVLILDDSLTVRMDLVEAFSAAGWRTAPCATAAQAWEVLATDQIDAIVLDVLLPDADGVDVLHALRAAPATASVPVLMLSTEAAVKDRIRGLRTGADEYVGKPYDSAYLVARAEELIGRTADPTAGSNTTVLVISDSASVRGSLQQAMEGSENTVLVASSGLEGLRLAASQRADAVVVSATLPDMEGTALIRRLRLDAALRGSFCLLLTGSDDVSAQLHALESGADAFVREDEAIEVVAAKVAAALRQASQGTGVDTASLLGPKKILSIGGASSLPAMLTERVRGEGYDVVSARSAADALELLAIQTVDCILLQAGERADDQDGDALGLVRQIKSVPELRDVPLLFLSDNDDPQLMIDALASGADDYVRTGGNFEILAARIRAQLRRKQQQDEHRGIRETLLRKEIEATQARAEAEIAQNRAAMVEELERKNQELETFSYSVSHDLRAPLRTVGGFTTMLVESLDTGLDDIGKHYVERIKGGLARMTEMIDDLLELSRVGRAPVQRADMDLAEVAEMVLNDLADGDPGRDVQTKVQTPLPVYADRRLIRNVFENLIGNAWKFTAHTAHATIEIGVEATFGDGDGGPRTYYIRDNGNGFDMARAEKLFSPFQRLHHQSDFPGTGIGLATVHRIIDRHGGRVWADAQPGLGATFRFTLPPRPTLSDVIPPDGGSSLPSPAPLPGVPAGPGLPTLPLQAGPAPLSRSGPM